MAAGEQMSDIAQDARAAGEATPAPKTIVILPTFNERPNLEGLVTPIRGFGCDVVVVDDNSPDGTGDLAERIGAEDPGVHVVHRSGKLGLGTAYVAGMTHAIERGYELVVTMDADGSHNPRHLPALTAAAHQRDALAIGSRYVPGGEIAGWTRRRKFLSHGANIYARTILGVRVHDCTSGYRCYPRWVLEEVDIHSIRSDGYAFLTEMLYLCLRCGIQVVEVPIRFEDRLAGQSKVSSAEILKAIALVPRLRLGGTATSGRRPVAKRARHVDTDSDPVDAGHAPVSGRPDGGRPT